MEHVAIDLGGRESQICVRNADMTVVEEKRLPTAKLEAFLKGRPKSRVIVEASSEAFAVADMTVKHGHEIRVVASNLVRQLGVGERGIKNDQRDGRKLSEVSCKIDLPSIHVPSQGARERKAMCSMRDSLVEARTLLVNTVRGWLRTQLVRIRTGSVASFPRRVCERLSGRPEGVPPFVGGLLVTIDGLTEQIKAATRQLKELALADPTCRRLMTVPGVGAVTVMRYTSTVDQVERFADAHALASYLGLTPGENSSSERQRRTGITKAGSPQTRKMLVQAAWVIVNTRPNDPMAKWAQQLALRRSNKIAIVALARKLAGILFAIWRDSSVYNPNYASEATDHIVEG